MALTPDRQGYLGSLDTKTLPQLQELLARQEKLLSDRKLVEGLPDNGEKAQKFAEKLRHIIESRKPESRKPESRKPESRKPGSNASNQTAPKNISMPPLSDVKECGAIYIKDSNEEQTIDALLSRNEENLILLQHEEKKKEIDETCPAVDVVERISSNLEEFHIASKSQDVQSFSNSYERVVKKAAETPEDIKSKYLPNRTLKHPVEESPSLHRDKASIKKIQPFEESAVNPPPYTHQSTKLISVEESVMLIQEQRKKNENWIAERAAQRLAEQLGPKMKTYSPATPDMQYRESKKDKPEELYDSDDVPSDEDVD